MALATLLAAIASRARAQSPEIEAAPMHAAGKTPVYPRLVKFPDAGIMSRINALLAAQEKTDRASRAGCLAQLKESGQKPDADSYREDIQVSYLTRHYLSVNVISSSNCGGPYPTEGAETPVTFDLDSGLAIDWAGIFKPGFIATEDPNMPTGLTRLYRARYSRAKDDEDAATRSSRTTRSPNHRSSGSMPKSASSYTPT